MINNNYDTNTLLSEAFGIKNVVAYNPKIDATEDQDIEISRLSYLGTPIVYPLTLKGKLYKQYDLSGKIVTKRLETFEMPAITLSTFRRGKILTETDIVGGNGSVIETYGFTSWNIDIRGLCLKDPAHPNAQTAYQQHLKILGFENVMDSIPVVSKLYNDKGIESIVIVDVELGQIEGKPDVIPFFIRCIADEPVELSI